MKKGKSMMLKILGTAVVALTLAGSAKAAESRLAYVDEFLRVPCFPGDKIPERVTAIGKTSRNTIVELSGFRETRTLYGIRHEPQWTEITEPGGARIAGEYAIKKGSHHPQEYLEIFHYPGANGDQGIYELKIGRDSNFPSPRYCLKRASIEDELKREAEKFGPTAGFTQSPGN